MCENKNRIAKSLMKHMTGQVNQAALQPVHFANKNANNAPAVDDQCTSAPNDTTLWCTVKRMLNRL